MTAGSPASAPGPQHGQAHQDQQRRQVLGRGETQVPRVHRPQEVEPEADEAVGDRQPAEEEAHEAGTTTEHRKDGGDPCRDERVVEAEVVTRLGGGATRADPVYAQPELGRRPGVVVDDEAAEAADGPARGEAIREAVGVGPERQATAPEVPPRHRHRGQESAEGGETVPDVEELDGPGEVVGGVVEQGVAQVPSHRGRHHQPRDDGRDRVPVQPGVPGPPAGDVGPHQEARGHQEPPGLQGDGADVEGRGLEVGDQRFHAIGSCG